MGWSAELSRSLTPRAHAPLVTLGDASDYLLDALPWDDSSSLAEWRRAAELLFAAAQCESEDRIDAATEQLERALFSTLPQT